MTEPLHMVLGGPGPWILYQVADRPVYMRASDNSARVTVRALHDLDVARGEITRRAMQPATVVIDEHLGYADQFDTLAADVRLREVATIPTPLLYQVRALALQAWQLGTAADRARTEGALR